MQTSDTSALLATTTLSNVAHWLCIIICKAFWKRFVPPQAEVGQSRNDTLSRNSEQGHQARYCLPPSTGQYAGQVHGTCSLPAEWAVSQSLDRSRGVFWGPWKAGKQLTGRSWYFWWWGYCPQSGINGSNFRSDAHLVDSGRVRQPILLK